MKKLKGVHKFKSYQEMCAALDIVPAKRGEDKESQLKEIRMFYVVDINKSGRIILTRINRKKEQARLDLESGKIKEVYGEQINLKSPKCYSHTGIDQYLLFCALNNNTQTKQRRRKNRMIYTAYEHLPLIMSPKEVADILHLGKNTTYDLIRNEKIKSIRIGHNIRIPKNSLLEFLQVPNP